MRIITVNMQAELIKKVEDIMFKDECSSRSDFVRKAIKEFLEKYDWQSLMGYSQIITVNVENSVIEKITELSNNGVFLSRSELIRVATLLKVMEVEKRIEEEQKAKEEAEKLKPKTYFENDTEIIRIPITPEVYKTYKIIKK